MTSSGTIVSLCRADGVVKQRTHGLEHGHRNLRLLGERDIRLGFRLGHPYRQLRLRPVDERYDVVSLSCGAISATHVENLPVIRMPGIVDSNAQNVSITSWVPPASVRHT